MLRKLTTFLEMIKFSHSVFALPFALIAMLVAAGGVPRAAVVFWIVVAVVAARTAAMCFNRIADRDVDARNPRTQGRALVTGELSLTFAWGVLFASVGVFLLAAGMLNYVCLLLAPPCLAVLLGYSVTKRFTSWSHVVLGVALGLAPLGAWLAVRGAPGLFPLLLGAGVALWVAGFDVMYSCQDYEVDRADPTLHSMPKRLGVAGALDRARRFHAVALTLFVLAWWVGSPPLGLPFLLALAGVGGLMVYQHGLVHARDLSRLDAAFFTTNGAISLGLLAVAWLDI
ncbi:MAG: putative 4-hydroxybenzoate polyprenyltransferase [Candidatus Sumerlaeia bacterium]|nr:putative 4-hydroxybenzoate polyprenyltransferase [Candidatus Sumerlaeia bacterium]